MPSLPTPAQILARFYEAETAYMAASPSERDFAGGMGKTLAPDFTSQQSPDLPWGGAWKGHKGFQNWSEIMASLFSSLEVQEPRIFEKEGEDEVVVVSTLRLVTREGGKEWAAPLTQTVKVDREKGWITEIRPFYWDVAGLRRLLGK